MKTKFLLALLPSLALAACTPAPQPPLPSQSAPAPYVSSSVVSNGYPLGYDTYYVALRRDIPANWGVAAAWYANAQEDGFEVGTTPRQGAIAWTDEGQFGHVAIVDSISADGTRVTISTMNGNEGWNRVTTRTAPATAFKYIY